jgi:hypothetical protein
MTTSAASRLFLRFLKNLCSTAELRRHRDRRRLASQALVFDPRRDVCGALLGTPSAPPKPAAIFWSEPTACSNESRLMFWAKVKWKGINGRAVIGQALPALVPWRCRHASTGSSFRRCTPPHRTVTERGRSGVLSLLPICLPTAAPLSYE